MQKGLNSTTTIGRGGRFRSDAGNYSSLVGNTLIHGTRMQAVELDGRGALIGAPHEGLSISRQVTDVSWTGRTYEIETDGNRFQMDCRYTLPGPLFTVEGTRWGYDFAVGASSFTIEDLPSGEKHKGSGVIENPAQVLLAHGGHTKLLIVTSQPAIKLEIFSFEHWWFTFPKPGARILMIPLKAEQDAPRDEAAVQQWLDLISTPPIHCEETFEITDNTLMIESRFSSAEGKPCKFSPLPLVPMLLNSDYGLQKMPESSRLLQSVLGPYCVTPGNINRRRIDLSWTKACVRRTREISGQLPPLPIELAYAGDQSWDESTPMDALLSLRIWAQLAKIMPPELWEKVKERVSVPSADAFRESLIYYTEPTLERQWCKDRSIFAYHGETSYDADWYNGLTLSGLWRAADCCDTEVAEAAQALSKAIRPERDAMVAYYELFNGWALGGAWTDPRGEVWDLDCATNALEGLLGEARLRELEGDTDGAAFMYYLTGRQATSIIAGALLGEWMAQWNLSYDTSRSVKGQNPLRSGNISGSLIQKKDALGSKIFRESRGCVAESAYTKHPFTFTGDFPEFNALQREYGPKEQYARLLKAYEEHTPQRYEDWLAFDLGEKVAAKLRTSDVPVVDGLHEAREQGVVFYAVSPDVCTRLWTLQ